MCSFTFCAPSPKDSWMLLNCRIWSACPYSCKMHFCHIMDIFWKIRSSKYEVQSALGSKSASAKWGSASPWKDKPSSLWAGKLWSGLFIILWINKSHLLNKTGTEFQHSKLQHFDRLLAANVIFVLHGSGVENQKITFWSFTPPTLTPDAHVKLYKILNSKIKIYVILKGQL